MRDGGAMTAWWRRRIADLWTVAGGWPGRIVTAGCMCIAFGYFLIVALMIYVGGTWAHVVYAEWPYAHIAGGVAFALLAWVFARGYRESFAAWRKLGARILLGVVSLLLSFAMGEALLRISLLRTQKEQSLDRLRELRKQGRPLPVSSSHPLAYIIEPSDNGRDVYQLQPTLSLEFGHKTLRTNADGMRADHDYPVERLPNSVRIIGIGDSGMFGWNTEQGENYMAVLESLLKARSDGVTYEVLNLAVPGYNTQLEVEHLRAVGLKYQPDVVVLGWCVNDYQLPMFLIEQSTIKYASGSYLHKLLFDRAHFAEAVNGINFRDLRDYNPDNVAPELQHGAGVEGVREALYELREMGNEHSFSVLVFGPLKETEIALCREVGLPYFNTYDGIPSDSVPADWAVHFMHPRPEGHRVLAERLEGELLRYDWLAPYNKKSKPDKIADI